MHASRIVESCATATLLSVIALFAACSPPKPTIRTNVQPGAQLSGYHTYGFVTELGTNRSGYSTPITTYFKDAIRHEMDARGYQYADAKPDLLVNFNANAHEAVDVQSTPAPATYGYYGYRRGLYGAGAYAGSEVDTVRYKVGTANVDLVDTSKKQVVWEGVAEGRLSDEMMKNPQPAISSVIAEMFAKFPSKAGGSP